MIRDQFFFVAALILCASTLVQARADSSVTGVVFSADYQPLEQVVVRAWRGVVVVDEDFTKSDGTYLLEIPGDAPIDTVTYTYKSSGSNGRLLPGRSSALSGVSKHEVDVVLFEIAATLGRIEEGDPSAIGMLQDAYAVMRLELVADRTSSEFYRALLQEDLAPIADTNFDIENRLVRLDLRRLQSQFSALANALGNDRQRFSPGSSIVDVAAKSDNLQTFAAAVRAAGLVETLEGEGPFTIFVPTDEAFRKLPVDTLQNLLKPENKDKLIAILKYHVVPGKIMAKDVVRLDGKSVAGQKFKVTIQKGKVKIDNATVVKADIPTSNGVMHIIDTVILPGAGL